MDRAYVQFARGASESMSKEKLLEAIKHVVAQPPDEKLRFLFDAYDVRGKCGHRPSTFVRNRFHDTLQPRTLSASPTCDM